MSKKTTRIKADAIEHWVPRDRDEVNDAIAKIGEHQRERLRIETALNDEQALVKARYDAEAKPHGERISELTKGVKLWCEANRAMLTHDGKIKFHTFATGEVKWRLRPPSISTAGSKTDVLVSLLEKLGFERFLRKKVELDKDAMLKEPEIAGSIAGIKIVQKEDFVVVPHESQIEEVQP